MVYILVHRYKASKGQLVRLPTNANNTLPPFIKQAALKLNLKKKEIKKAKLHHKTSKQLITTLQDIDHTTPLLLLTATESSELLASIPITPQSIIRPKHRLPELPEVIWELIAIAKCEQFRSFHQTNLQARLQQLRATCNNDNLQILSQPIRPRRFQNLPTKQSDNSSVVQCQQIIILSMLNKRWHRIIGTSKHFELLGSWFFQEERSKKWIPYSVEANWDLEVARILNKEEITVAICEPKQNQGRNKQDKRRRKHVKIDLVKKIQLNLKKASKGKKYKVKRLPTDMFIQ